MSRDMVGCRTTKLGMTLLACLMCEPGSLCYCAQTVEFKTRLCAVAIVLYQLPRIPKTSVQNPYL